MYRQMKGESRAQERVRLLKEAVPIMHSICNDLCKTTGRYDLRDDALDTARAWLDGKYLDEYDPEISRFTTYLWRFLHGKVSDLVFREGIRIGESLPPEDIPPGANPGRTHRERQRKELELQTLTSALADGLHLSVQDARKVFEGIVLEGEFGIYYRLLWRRWLADMTTRDVGGEHCTDAASCSEMLLMPPAWYECARERATTEMDYLAAQVARASVLSSEEAVLLLRRTMIGEESVQERLLLRHVLASLS